MRPLGPTFLDTPGSPGICRRCKRGRRVHEPPLDACPDAGGGATVRAPA